MGQKNMKNQLISIACIVIIALCVIGMYLNKIKNLKQDNRAMIEAYRNKEVHNANLQIMVTKYGDSLTVARQTVLTKDAAISLGLLREKELKAKHLKEVANVIELKEEIKILNKPGTASPFIIIVRDTVYAQLPFDLEFSDDWYSLLVTADRVPTLKELTVFSQPTITLGVQRNGLFQKRQAVTIYENKNPYIELKDISSLTIEDNERFYEKTWFKVLGGFTGGMIFTTMIK